MIPPPSSAPVRVAHAPLPAETQPGTAAWRRCRAREIVRDHVLLAAGANFIPVPIVDSLAVAAVQLRMLAELSRLYGRKFESDAGRNLLASLSLGFVHHVFTRHGTAGGFKMALAGVPLVGRALSFFLWPAVFAVFTHFLGEACARHYEAGGQFSDFTAATLVNTPFAPFAVDVINRN